MTDFKDTLTTRKATYFLPFHIGGNFCDFSLASVGHQNLQHGHFLFYNSLFPVEIFPLKIDSHWQFEKLKIANLKIAYTSIQMKCQGGVIFVHAPRLFYYPKRRIGYARCSLTGNKNYPAITKLTNTM